MPADACCRRTIARLRRQRWTGKQIATEAGVSPATVSRDLAAWA
ncbi:helix-turn-helix domain-containing protein [Mesorhizobium sp.]